MIGAGAAGIFAALAARGAFASSASSSPPSVVLLDSKESPGKKILVSGGGRCNVTNVSVTDRDFDTDAPAVVRGVLANYPVPKVRAFFEERGVVLVEEPIGKLFPREGGAKGVLAALFRALDEAGVVRSFGAEIFEVERDGDGWKVGEVRARRVIVATGGRSIPQTGSTGFGYGLARSVGHEVVEPVPALTPLRGRTPHDLAGVTVPAILTVEDHDGRVLRRAVGSLLFTHGGVSGPAALDASVAVAHAVEEERPFRVRADFWSPADPAGPFGPYLGQPKLPGSCMAESPVPTDARTVERFLLASEQRELLGTVLGRRLPRRLVEALAPAWRTPLGRLVREDRRIAAESVSGLDLGITGVLGFEKAEVTAGGVPLRELDRRTLESRRAPGLFFCGEVCHATGRLGGFNFQWAWSSGFAAGRGAGESSPPDQRPLRSGGPPQPG